MYANAGRAKSAQATSNLSQGPCIVVGGDPNVEVYEACRPSERYGVRTSSESSSTCSSDEGQCVQSIWVSRVTYGSSDGEALHGIRLGSLLVEMQNRLVFWLILQLVRRGALDDRLGAVQGKAQEIVAKAHAERTRSKRDVVRRRIWSECVDAGRGDVAPCVNAL